jgi:hypothetical protein
MSAPDVNIEKQKHRHRTMVRGLWVGAAIALLVVGGIAISAGVFDTDPADLIPAGDAQAG